MPTALEQSRKLTKEYDFRTLKTLDEFTTRYIWPRAEVINKEQQFYIDPKEVANGHSPFVLSSNGLAITAKSVHPDIADYAVALSTEGRAIGLGNLTPEQFVDHATRQPYTSGLLTTRDNGHNQLHGYWEISAKLPSASGAWPAFWLLPTHEQWPPGVAMLSEIDAMEATEKVRQGIYHGSMHTNETGQKVSSKDNDIDTKADLTNEYHRYGVSWEADFIIWYFNGTEVIRRKTPADMLDTPRHFLLNLAVGGWAGTPDPADYPSSFDIEWVRIYENAKQKTKSVSADDILIASGDPTAINNAATVMQLTADYLRSISKII